MMVVISNLLVLSFVSQPVQELSSYFHLSIFEFIIYTEVFVCFTILSSTSTCIDATNDFLLLHFSLFSIFNSI